MKKTDKIILSGLVGVLLFRPIIPRFMPLLDFRVGVYTRLLDVWSTGVMQLSVLLLGALALLFNLFGFRDLSKMRIPNSHIFLGAFLILSAVSLFYSVELNMSINTLIGWIASVTVFYITASFVKGEDRVRSFTGLFLGIAFVVSWHALFQYFFLYGFIQRSFDLGSVLGGLGSSMVNLKRVGSVFGWPNVLASFLIMAIPLGLSFTIYEKRFGMKLALAIMTLVMFGGMLVTFSIGGWISLFLVLIIQYLLLRHRNFNLSDRWGFLTPPKVSELESSDYRGKSGGIKSNRRLFVIAALLVLLIVGILIHKRATVITMGSIKGRIAFLTAAVNSIKDHPVFGTGIGTFKSIYMRYMLPGPFETQHAHNSYLEIWSELGIGGVVLFIGFIVVVLRRGFRYIKMDTEFGFRKKYAPNPEPRIPNPDKCLAIGLICGIMGFAIHNIAEFSFFVPSVQIFWWFLAGMLAALCRGSVQDKALRISKAAQSFLRLIALVGLSTAILFLVKCNIAEIYFYRGFKAASSGDFGSAFEEYAKAEKINSYDSKYPYIIAETNFLLAKNSKSPQRLLDSAIESGERAFSLNKYGYAAYALLGRIYYERGDIERAIEFYKRASEVFPANQRYREAAEFLNNSY